MSSRGTRLSADSASGVPRVVNAGDARFGEAGDLPGLVCPARPWRRAPARLARAIRIRATRPRRAPPNAAGRSMRGAAAEDGRAPSAHSSAAAPRPPHADRRNSPRKPWPGRAAGQARGNDVRSAAIHQGCGFCTNFLLPAQHLRREDRYSVQQQVPLVQIRLPALRPAQAPHFDASADLLAAVLFAVPSTPDLSGPV